MAELKLANLLLAMAPDRKWMPGAGPHSTLLTDLLDDGTPLIEERVSFDGHDDPSDWLVRLTEAGVEQRARISEAWAEIALVLAPH